GVGCKLGEEILRLRAIEVDRFEHESGHALGPAGSEKRGDDGAVAVAPEDRSLDRQRVEKMFELDHAVVVIPDRQVVVPGGAAIAAPVRKDHSVGSAEHRDRVVERHDAAAPAAVKTDQRRSLASLLVPDPGTWNLDERHAQRAPFKMPYSHWPTTPITGG